MQKIKKGDDVIVTTGKDKGKRGSIVRVLSEIDRVIVENVNIAKKHQKPNPAVGAPGGIIEKEMPIDISNVAIFNPVTGKADRVGIKTLEDGRKVRFFKSNGEVIDA
jgi:large subunit ribosomal protein L24